MQEEACPTCKAVMETGARYCGRCGKATAPTRSSEHLAQTSPKAKLIGHEVGGRYRVLSKLGEGGMGAVYRAEQISLKRIVALKILKPELSSEPGLVRRFNTEATLAAKLNHPNTVTLYDFGQDHDGSLYIAMEFIEGHSLRQVLVREGPLAPARVFAIVTQICGSLADAHSTGIVHRDLKPDNVMLFVRGKQKEAVSVLDFGIAKLRDEHGNITQQPMTQVGDILGTPQYMAPEQIRGDRVDARTDVYALGVMLYEMLTARLPFEGATVLALLSKHLTEVPLSPSQKRPELAIPQAMSDLVMRCLAKSPAERPGSMDEVEQSLATIDLATMPMVQTPAKQSPGTIDLATMDVVMMPQSETPRSIGEAPTGYASPVPSTGPRSPMQTPVGAMPTTEIPKRSFRILLWIALVVVAAGGVGAYLMYRPGNSEESEGESDNEEDGFDVSAWENSQGTLDDGEDDQDDDGDELYYADPAFDYELELPSGFVGSGDHLGNATFVGSVDGHVVTVVTSAWSEPGAFTEANMEAALANHLVRQGMTVTSMRWQPHEGKRMLRGNFIAPATNQEGRFVLIRRQSEFYFAAVGGPKHAKGSSFYEEFLNRRFQVD